MYIKQLRTVDSLLPQNLFAEQKSEELRGLRISWIPEGYCEGEKMHIK